MADDLGYGDVGCYGASLVDTPRIDSIARDGVLFTDAHTPSPLCTPTRYTLLTGEYYFRIGATRGRQWNQHRRALLGPGQMTMASLLRSAGYATGFVGKWHLGFGNEKPDWNGELRPGPLEAGFDYCFGVPNANSEAPFIYFENHGLLGLDPKDPIAIPGEARGSYGKMTGGESARWDNETIALTQTARAVSYIEEHRTEPFFLYFAPCNVHVPLTPNERFEGTSRCGTYGDFIQELDWSVGEVLSTLDRLGLMDNTLVVFTSDNGGVYHREAFNAGHRANGDLIGQKMDVWEGGHRVPFVARWPEHIPAGARSDDVICLADMLATMAALVGRELPHEAGPDSFNVLSSLLDEPGHKPGRESLLMSWPGNAVREGKWLLLRHQGSGGVTTRPSNKAGEGWMNYAEMGFTNSDYTSDGRLKPDAPEGQLYDMSVDPGQSVNLYREHPDIVAHLEALDDRIRSQGRSRP
jgi:arylsulfatase A-like enzyme